MQGELTDAEIKAILREKYGQNDRCPVARRKSKLKMRFKGDRLDTEIERTEEKLRLLKEIRGY